MDILFLSHSVPNPPDKGERIRAFHELTRLAAEHRVHLACFARHPSEAGAAHALSDRCASVYVETIDSRMALAKAVARFAAGGCLNEFFYHSARMRRHVEGLAARVSIRGALAYSVVMAPYVPRPIPFVLDMIDVDSEKWFQYAGVRRPAFAYAMEARRLRRMEARCAGTAVRTLLATSAEEQLLLSFAPGVATGFMENGVDFDFFDPAASPGAPELARKRYLVFIGTLDYYPNIEAACRFAREVFPTLRQREPRLEFFVVGRNPARAVRKLSAWPGVQVTGTVPDVRPYLKHALCQVVPLRIARGVQNKVLEALAAGKPSLVSAAVAKTFGDRLPRGVFRCESAEDYQQRLRGEASFPVPEEIREDARKRYSWPVNMGILAREMRALGA